MHSPAAAIREPFFPEDAVIRRVHRHGVILLGGGRALLMQIAHPDVARGVAEHSSYRHDRIGRLLRTLQSTLAMVYGSREQALQAASRINRLHHSVTGQGYQAMAPELLVWVLSTLIDTTLVMHQRFVGPLSEDAATVYYQEMGIIGRYLGVPDGALPADLPAFRQYMAVMNQNLTVSAEARSIAHDLFQPMPGTGPAMLAMKHLTAGLLPPPLRNGFGLGWGPGRSAQLSVVQSLSRAVLPWLPPALSQTPSLLLPKP